MRKLLATSLIIAVTAVSYGVYVGTAQAAWYDTDWSNRVSVTVQSSQVGSNLTNFPVYVDLSDLSASFHSTVKSDGCDIRVTESDETTETPIELVNYDSASDTGELHFLADSLSSSSNTTFYIYYGNSGASCYADSATNGAENVWANGQQGVWHMNEDPSGTAPQILDSTSNNNNGNSTGSMTSDDLVSGQVGQAIEFDGGNDYIDISSDLNSLFSDEATLSVWLRRDVNTPGTGSNTGFFWLGTGVRSHYPWTDGALYLTTFADSRIISGADNTGFDKTNWHHLVITTSPGAGNYKVYQDTTLNHTGSGPSSISLPNSIYMGNSDSGNSYFFPGRIDNVRLYNSSLSDDWISAEYTNQNTSTTFYSVGTEEDAPATGATEGPQLSINNGAVRVDSEGTLRID